MLKVLFPWKQNNTKKVLLSMEQQVVKEEVTEEPHENLPLLPCHVCNRTFLPKPLQKHIRICEQMAHKKRKPFDSLKQRIEGTDLAPFFQKSYLKKHNTDINSHALAGDVYGNRKQSKWKEKHLELVNTIRNAKGASPEMSSHSSSTAATPNKKINHLAVSQTSLNERCPCCDRAFGPKAFDRHVEWCRERKTRVYQSPANVQQAKERLDARIKYRVPPLKQPKRVTVRAKYSPTSQAKPVMHRSNSMLTGKSTTSLGCSSTVNIIPTRRKPINNSEKDKETNQGNREHDSRSRFDKGIGDCGEIKEKEKCDSNLSKSFQTKRTIPIKKINNSTVNNGLQDIKVSSLCIAKNKKLLKWRETPKISPTKIEVVPTEANRNREKRQQSNLDLSDKNTKTTDGEKKRTPVKAVTNIVLSEKLNSPDKKQKLTNRSISENESRSLKFSDTINIGSSEGRYINSSQSMEKTLNFDNLHAESSSITVNTSDFEGDIDTFRCPLNDGMNKESDTMVGSDMESILSSHGSANTITYTCDDNKNKNILVVVQDKGSNIMRRNEREKEANVDLVGKFTKESTEHRTELVNNTRSTMFVQNMKDENRNTHTANYTRQSSKANSEMACVGNPQSPKGNIDLNLKQEFEIHSDNESSEMMSLNDQEFSESMNMHRFKKNKEKEELRLLERNRLFPLASEKYERRSQVPLSAESEHNSLKIVPRDNEMFEQRSVKECETKICRKSSSAKLSDVETLQEINICDNTRIISNKKMTLRKTSGKTRSWKRRQKMKKFRMCIKCFLRNIRSRKVLNFNSNVKDKANYCDSLDSTEENTESLGDSSVDDNSLVLCSEVKEAKNMELSAIPTALNICIRKSKSATETVGENCENEVIRSEKPDVVHSRNRIYDKTFRSLPNISIISNSDLEVTVEEWFKENEKCSTVNSIIIPEDSVDSVVPRKRRRISGSPPTSAGRSEMCIEKEVQSLQTNISKIKTRKLEKDDPPVILNYEQVALSSESKADILYVNRVFSCLISPERSELESGNEPQIDEVRDIADDEIKNWEADEEQISKNSKCDEFVKPKDIKSGAEISRSLSANCARSASFHMEPNDSSKALRNSSACSNMNRKKDDTCSTDCKEDKFEPLSNTEKHTFHITSGSKVSTEIIKRLENNSCQTLFYEINSKNSDNIAYRLPKIKLVEKLDQQTILSSTPKANMKLPVIFNRNSKLSKDTCLDESPIHETIQVPSSIIKPKKVSICQQTSRQEIGIDGTHNYSNEFCSTNRDAYLRKAMSSTISSSTALYDPFELAQRQFMELLDHDDDVRVVSSQLILKTPDHSNFKTQNIHQHTTRNTTPRIEVKRASVIEPPYNFQDKINTLDGEFELIESLLNNNILNEVFEITDSDFLNLENLRCTGDYADSTQIKLNDDMSSIDPNLINEHDNLSIPENLFVDEFSPTSSIDSELTIHSFKPFIKPFDGITIGKGSGCAPAESVAAPKSIHVSSKNHSIRPAPDGSSGEAETTENRLNLKTATNLGQLSRTDNKFKIDSSGGSEKKKDTKTPTVTNSNKPTPFKNRDLKTFYKEKDQHEKNSLKVDSDGIVEILRAEELFAVDDKMYEEYKKYEETYLKEKSKKYSTKKQKNKTADFGIILDDRVVSTCDDSAYGSLNRRQPKEPEVTVVTQNFNEEIQSTSGGKMSKFCHECGNKYPVSSAKFCVECGVKRLVL